MQDRNGPIEIASVLLLLDTHILIWLTEVLPELTTQRRREIDEAAQSDGVLVSSISFWETAMLSEKRRIALKLPLLTWRDVVLSRPGIVEAMVDSRIAIDAVTLPGDLHSDPADRLLISTARHTGATLMTRDVRILEYAAAGHVKAVEA